MAAIGSLCLDQILVLRPGDGGGRGHAAHGRWATGSMVWWLVLPFSSSMVMLVRRRLGAGAEGVAGACWWHRGGASSCAGLLPMEALRRREGVGYRLDQELAAGMVLSRAKAFTDAFVGGNGGGALVAPFSLLGAPL